MRILKIDELEARIDRRKAQLGLAGDRYVLANSGASRSEEKRELLRAISLRAAEQGRRPAFEAQY
jgi:hypothetical protein